jgi:choline monooxygenase
LDGSLKGAPEFEGVCNFDRTRNGLVPVQVAVWEQFVFVNLDAKASSLETFLGRLTHRTKPLDLMRPRFFERRTYSLNCNWKVFVDNYLDGGYHVPHLHKALNTVLDYRHYTIENEDRYCLQSSPMVEGDEAAATSATRQGDRAWYFWQYPNLMISTSTTSAKQRLSAIARASLSVSGSTMKTWEFASRCSEAYIRVPMELDGYRCGARRGSICFTGCWRMT